MAEYINTLIDNLYAVSLRLLDFPVYALLPAVTVVSIITGIFIRKIAPGIWTGNFKCLYFSLSILLLIVFIFDHKLRTLEKNLDQAHLRLLNVSTPEIKNERINRSSDREYNLDSLNDIPGGFSYWQTPVNQAIDLITIHKENPAAVAFIAVADLNYPGIEVVLTPKIREKYYTSQFARENNCDIAINGEAGVSMAQGCPLGEWTGNFIVNGKALLLEDGPLRPFLSFDKYNQARYYRAGITDTSNTGEKYNTIWGRFDLLVSGEYPGIGKNEKPYARTCMAIDKDGRKLYLMIVDGKRPDYSLGLSYRECAQILKALGAWEGMACDQGGSSCMYLKQNDRIINRPADSDGYERYVYTHFGLRITQ